MKTTSTTIIRKVEIYCRTCNQEIRFDKNQRTATCKWIPLNMDLSYHDCPAKQKRQQQPPQQQKQKARKFQPCRNKCGTHIIFDVAHKSVSGKFVPLQKDSTGQLVPHDCPAKKQQQPPIQRLLSNNNNNLSKEIAAIKAQLLILVSRLDRLEQELQK